MVGKTWETPPIKQTHRRKISSRKVICCKEREEKGQTEGEIVNAELNGF